MLGENADEIKRDLIVLHSILNSLIFSVYTVYIIVYKKDNKAHEIDRKIGVSP